MLVLGLATSRQVLELSLVLVWPLPSFEEFPISVGLNHLVPLSFHVRAGQLDHRWVSRFYNIQLAQESSQLFLSRRGGQLEDSLYLIRRQPPGPMCNLNSQVSDLCLDHLCLSIGDFIPPFRQKV